MNTTEEREISLFLNNNNLTQFSFKWDEKDYQKQENCFWKTINLKKYHNIGNVSEGQ
jgi:hypothetical protein